MFCLSIFFVAFFNLFFLFVFFLLDRSIHLGDHNSASAEGWRVLSEEERDEYRNQADQEPPKSVTLKQKMDQLFDLVLRMPPINEVMKCTLALFGTYLTWSL